MDKGVGALLAAVVAAAASLPVPLAVLAAGTLAGCTPVDPDGGAPRADWAVYTVSRPGYDYRVEYPAGWTVEEGPAATRFAPEGVAPEAGLRIVVFDPAETPPPPVAYTYTTVRVIEAEGRAIPVEHRDPSPATEAYLVRLQEGRYTAELHFALDLAYDAVFDHVVLSFSLSPKPR